MMGEGTEQVAVEQVVAVKHPAKFSQPILEQMVQLLDRYDVKGQILDPFAGVGKVHELAGGDRWTIGVEIEREWADQHPNTICGDSRDLGGVLDRAGVIEGISAVVTSPTYGNRMADSYAGDKKGSTRHTYRVYLGRELSGGNSGGMQWGKKYRDLHSDVWGQVFGELVRGATRGGGSGMAFINVSNHIRGGKEVDVVRWHVQELIRQGFRIVDLVPVQTARLRHGANSEKRVAAERIIVAKVG